MKIFKSVNFNNKPERKALIYSLLIFIVTNQVVALTIWYLFDLNYFLALLFVSLVGFLFANKVLKKKHKSF